MRVGADWKCEAAELLSLARGASQKRRSAGLSLAEEIEGPLSWYSSYSSAAPTEADLTFQALADQWREETAACSSVTMMSMNQAYQRIIGMGQKAVPLILRDLIREPDHWFWALTAITGENPVDPRDAGDLEKMTDAWVQLGKQRGWV